jgi:glycosyltransferase involved in cell wall biosynthesis
MPDVKPDDVAVAAPPRRLPASPAVGVLVPEFPSQTHVFFWREVQAWRAAGATVKIISTRRPPDEACRHEFADEARQTTFYAWPPKPAAALGTLANPVGVARALKYVASLSDKKKAAALVPAAEGLRRWAKQNDIAHIHGHSCADAAHLLALCDALGGPTYSLTLHGDFSVYGTDHPQKLKHCTVLGCDGPHLLPQIEAVGYPLERALPNWMGVDTDKHTPPSEPRDAAAGRLKIVTVARLNKNKGHVYALEAIRRCVDDGLDVSYELIGGGDYQPQVEADIKRLNLTDRVTLRGTLGEGDVRAALLAADVFCLPSIGLGEAGPISVMEACAVELPVVCSVIGSTPHMVVDGETGFLCKQQDVAALAEAFAILARDVARRHTMGRAARAFAVEHFDSRRTAVRLWEHIARFTPAIGVRE